MGLDMYLYARKKDYISEYFGDKGKDIKYPKELKVFEADLDGISVETKIDYRIAYWRKANAIHRFFVEHCAGGVDDCSEMIVNEDTLHILLDKIDLVLSHHELAKQILPTHDGFFFGDAGYTEWYFNELEYTKRVVENAIKLLKNEDYEIIYQASW